MSLANTFHFKADRAFDEIEMMLRALQSELSATREELRALKAQKRNDHPHPIGHRWVFDATDPVYFTDALSQAEEIEPGAFKRWVLGDRPLEVFLRLRRDISYVVTVQLADMVEGAEVSATVDGNAVPVRLNARTLRFLAPRDMARFDAGDGLNLAVATDRIVHDGSGNDTRVLRFSLRSIEVAPVELEAKLPAGGA